MKIKRDQLTHAYLIVDVPGTQPEGRWGAGMVIS